MQGYPPPPNNYPPVPGAYDAPPPGAFGAPPAMMQNAPYGVEPFTGLPYSDKQKMVAGLLQLLLPFIGICGVGRLYTGHVLIGVLQLCLGWLTCGIWPMIDGVLLLTGKVRDSEGRPLRD